ncbi:isocitrate lyase/PEP mutase family protein [Nonomuraea antri]|uniref:isocitrate lyase/PEP mutase family protein n=1 Tax=Nonomuraea antri TaxID=2730852 RepID=UPI001F1A1D5C|nr:isocitrate lyase/phosphoenolpyruvate mutase family protein [Nonomuraea antri]
MTTPAEKAELFRSLHVPGRPLLLPNAWDVASALVAEAAGAQAIATTSAGVAWSLGSPDGDALGRDRALDLIARIAAAVGVPVTADIEGGYAADPAGVGETARGVIDAGAVGVNLEDADHGGAAPLLPIEAQAARIAAVRRAADASGVPLFVNARTDVYLRAVGDPGSRLDEVLARAAAYAEAGADGLFVPGLMTAAELSVLAEKSGLPVNAMAGPGAPPVAELAGLGVARISLGSSVARPPTPWSGGPRWSCSGRARTSRWPGRSTTARSTPCSPPDRRRRRRPAPTCGRRGACPGR